MLASYMLYEIIIANHIRINIRYSLADYRQTDKQIGTYRCTSLADDFFLWRTVAPENRNTTKHICVVYIDRVLWMNLIDFLVSSLYYEETM